MSKLAEGEIDKQLEQIVARTHATQRGRIEVPPGVLYQYTDARGLLGIVESKSIWATNARFLNDSAELEYVRSVLGRVARTLRINVRSPAAGLRYSGVKGRR